MTEQIPLDSELANEIGVLFREMSDAQARQQDEIGFGEEGHELRAEVRKWYECAEARAGHYEAHERPRQEAAKRLAEAERNLRNYYIAKLMLITTETAEAVEEIRHNRAIHEEYLTIDDREVVRGRGDFSHLWETVEQFEDVNGVVGPATSYSIDHVPKPEGVPSELADHVIRIWSLCGEAGIDLGPAIVQKLNYNATRAQRHGGKAI